MSPGAQFGSLLNVQHSIAKHDTIFPQGILCSNVSIINIRLNGKGIACPRVSEATAASGSKSYNVSPTQLSYVEPRLAGVCMALLP
jgi:hypothetical protein